MTKFFHTMLIFGTLTLLGCTGTQKSSKTVRPTKPEDPTEEVPASISRILPEEITTDNYKSKVQQFERELTREMRSTEKTASAKKETGKNSKSPE